MADIKRKKNNSGEDKIKKSPQNVKSKKDSDTKKDKKPFAYHLIPYVFALLAIFFALCFITNAICNPNNSLDGGMESDHTLGVVGFYFCEISMGLFGPGAYALPILMLIFVVFWKNYDRRSFVSLNLVILFITVMLISAFSHVVIHAGDGIEGFNTSAVLLYDEGSVLRGGGVIGGYIGFAIVSILNVVGAIFVIIGVLIPMFLFLLGTTPVEAAQWLYAKAKKATENNLERRAEIREARIQEREINKLAAKQEREERLIALEEKKNTSDGKKEKAAKLDQLPEKSEKIKKAKKTDDDVELLVLPENNEPVQPSENKKFEKDAEPEKIVRGGVIYNLPTEEDEEDKLTFNAFSNSGIKTDAMRDNVITPTNDDDEQVEDLYQTEKKDDVIVFTDNKAKKNKKSKKNSVDDIASELFDNEDTLVGMDFMIDEETGEVIEEEEPANEVDNQPITEAAPVNVPVPEYVFPPVDLLEMGNSKYSADPAEIEKNADILRGVLQDFRIPIKEISCSCGPTITRYEVKPEAGVRVRQIANLVDDISLGLAKSGVRIEAPIPGKAAVGIEVPNDKSSAVKLRNLIEHVDFVTHKSKLAACLGADVSGKPVMFDIEKMPHLLVAGTTGSGKSVCINSIIMSILYHAKPEEVKLLLIDPKKVEFKVYKDIPHLCCRIVSDPKKAAGALNTAVNEMEKRFELIEEVGVRNITGYNEITKNDPEKPYMPRLVIIIDEFADLMMTAKEEVETAVVRIAQKARAAGIHLIIGTQRPSVDVITGLIKANIPSRIAFTVMSGVDSRTILDTVGAEKLCGRGDMLYAPVGAQKPARVQGAFVSDEEVERVVSFVKANNAPVRYDHEFENSIDVEAARCGNSSQGGAGNDAAIGSGDEDALLYRAAELIIDAGKGSTSLLQRRLGVGYGRAAKMLDCLEEMGVIGHPNGTKPREVLVTRDRLDAIMKNKE